MESGVWVEVLAFPRIEFILSNRRESTIYRQRFRQVGAVMVRAHRISLLIISIFSVK